MIKLFYSYNNYFVYFRCCYIEIYNEKINDLLDITNKALTIREDINGRITHGARHAVVKSSEELVALLKMGNKNRKVGSTKMNERSSRSHTILQVVSSWNEQLLFTTLHFIHNTISDGVPDIKKLWQFSKINCFTYF